MRVRAMIRWVSNKANNIINLLRTYSRIIPDAIISFRRDGISIEGIDKNRIVLGSIDFFDSHLEEFGEYEIENELTIKLNLEFLKDIAVRPEDSFELRVDEDTSQMCLKIYGKNRPTREYVQQVNLYECFDEESAEYPNLEYEGGMILGFEMIAFSIGMLSGFSKTVKITIEKNIALLEGRGEDHPIITISEDIPHVYIWGNAVATYDSNNLLKILEILETYFVHRVSLELDTNGPLEIGGPFEEGSGYMEFYLAPLVKNKYLKLKEPYPILLE